MTWHQSTGHKGPVLRPGCIGTDRARTNYYSPLSNGLSLNVCGRTHTTHKQTHKHTHTHTVDTLHRRVLVKREMFPETVPVSEIILKKDSCSVGALYNIQEQGLACTGIGFKPSPIFHKEFDVHVTVHRDKFLIIKPTRCTNFSNLFLE